MHHVHLRPLIVLLHSHAIDAIVQHVHQHMQDALVSNPIRVNRVGGSVAVLAEILLRSPRKLFIFIIKKYNYRIKVSKK